MVPAYSNTKQKKPDLKVIPGRKNIRKKPRKGKGKGKSKKNPTKTTDPELRKIPQLIRGKVLSSEKKKKENLNFE